MQATAFGRSASARTQARCAANLVRGSMGRMTKGPPNNGIQPTALRAAADAGR